MVWCSYKVKYGYEVSLSEAIMKGCDLFNGRTFLWWIMGRGFSFRRIGGVRIIVCVFYFTYCVS